MKLSFFVLVILSGISYVLLSYMEVFFIKICGQIITSLFEAFARCARGNVAYQQPRPAPPRPQPARRTGNSHVGNSFRAFFRGVFGRNTNTTQTPRNAQSSSSSIMDTILLRKLSHNLSSVTLVSNLHCVGEEVILSIKVGFCFYFHLFLFSKRILLHIMIFLMFSAFLWLVSFNVMFVEDFCFCLMCRLILFYFIFLVVSRLLCFPFSKLVTQVSY